MWKENLLMLLTYTLIGISGVSAFLLMDIPTNKVFLSLIILIYPFSHFLMMQWVNRGHQDDHKEELHNTGRPKALNRNVHNG